MRKMSKKVLCCFLTEFSVQTWYNDWNKMGNFRNSNVTKFWEIKTCFAITIVCILLHAIFSKNGLHLCYNLWFKMIELSQLFVNFYISTLQNHQTTWFPNRNQTNIRICNFKLPSKPWNFQPKDIWIITIFETR